MNNMKYKIISRTPSIIWLDGKEIEEKIDTNYNNASFIEGIDRKYSKIDFKISLNEDIIEELTDYTANGSFAWLKENVIYSLNEGVPFIKIKNLTDNGFDFSNLEYITSDTYLKLKKSQLKGGELLFSKTGTIGVTVVVPKNCGEVSVADNIFRIVYKSNIDVHYIDAFYKSKYGKMWVERLSQGGVQQTIIKDSFRKIKIPIPPYEVQKYIGDKAREAEELREEVKKLKVELEILFKRYTGLKDEEVNGENIKNYGYVLPNDLGNMIGAEVYKPSYVENRRKIKKAGKYINLNECYDYIVNGVDYREYLEGYGTEYYKVGSISMFGIKNKERTFIDLQLSDISDKQKIEKGNLLITRKGSFGIAMAVTDKEEIGIISSEVFKLKVKDNWNADYLAYFLNSEFGKKQFNQYATGTTMKGINQQNIIEIIVPDISYSEQREIGNLVNEIKNNINKSEKLIKEAKQNIEDLIEGNLDMSKIKETN